MPLFLNNGYEHRDAGIALSPAVATILFILSLAVDSRGLEKRAKVVERLNKSKQTGVLVLKAHRFAWFTLEKSIRRASMSYLFKSILMRRMVVSNLLTLGCLGGLLIC